MNRQVGRLWLLGVCFTASLAAARAQPQAEPANPSHRPVGGDIGDLSDAEAFLARRLSHTHDIEEMQDLLQPLLKDKNFQKMLQEKLKDQDLQNLQNTIKNHPELLDDPALRNMLKGLGPLKQNGDLTKLPIDDKNVLAQGLKDFIDKHKLPELPPDGHTPDKPPEESTPPDLTHDSGPPKTSPPKADSQPNWVNRDVLDSMNRVFKDMGKSPEADGLRADILRELGKMDAGSPGSAAGLADFLKNVISSKDAAWLAENLKIPEGPKLGNLSGPSLPAGPSVGADSAAGALDGVVWIAALVLMGASAVMVFTMLRKHTAAARARAWSAGPWPVDPSQVSTREDLIRAFEHLAYLLLGPMARPLNHLEVASRLGGTDGRRAKAAARLAHLYEQARYAPPTEPLPPNELTAARGDLSALAGAGA